MMLWIILTYLDIILFVAIALTVLYLLIFAAAANFIPKVRHTRVRKEGAYLVLIPAYKEDAVIEDTLRAILNQDYDSKKFDVVVISDKMTSVTNMKIAQYPVTLLCPSFSESSKAKSLNFAMDHISTYKLYDMVIVLDADNIVDGSFISDINKAFQSGAKVIQTHRISKNLDTNSAIMDATFEEINNSIFRAGHVALGFSSSLIGSGIALDFKWFKENVKNLKTSGEDKELEALLLKQRIYVDYLEDTIILDEKKRKTKDFNKQRSRWFFTQFQNLKTNLKFLPVAIFTKNYDYADKIIQWMMLPRILMTGIIIFMSITLPFIYFVSALKWWLLFALVMFVYAIATPDYLVNSQWTIAFMSFPRIIWGALVSMLRIRKNASSTHTPKKSIFTHLNRTKK